MPCRTALWCLCVLTGYMSLGALQGPAAAAAAAAAGEGPHPYQLWIATELCNRGSLCESLPGHQRPPLACMHHQSVAIYSNCWLAQLSPADAAIDKGRLRVRNGSASLLYVLYTAQEIAGALLYLHEHEIVHRDL